MDGTVHVFWRTSKDLLCDKEEATHQGSLKQQHVTTFLPVHLHPALLSDRRSRVRKDGNGDTCYYTILRCLCFCLMRLTRHQVMIQAVSRSFRNRPRSGGAHYTRSPLRSG
jgi:hypothetical protein